MKILIVHPEPLLPVTSGGQDRAWHIADYLGQRHDVIFLSFFWGISKDKKIKEKNFVYLQKKIKKSFWDKVWIKFLHGSSLKKYFLHETEYIFYPSWIKFLKSFPVDLIIANHSFSFLVCWLGRKNQIPIVLDQQNVESEIRSNLKFFEKFALKHANFIACCSEIDKKKMIDLTPQIKNKITTIENGVNTDRREINMEERKYIRKKLGFNENDFVFCYHGAYLYPPNKESFDWIYKNLINFKNAKILLFGRFCKPKKNENIINLGCVDDPFKYIKACDAAIIPLSSGSGTRIKILEYFACGLPVISTPKGAEGLEIQNKKNIIIANLENFVPIMKELIFNKVKQKEIGKEGQKLVKNKYDWTKILKKYDQVIKNV